MGFKDYMELDIDTFMNFEEFGEYHIIDGKEILVIVDDNEYIKRTKGEGSRVDGVFQKTKLFYVKSKDFGNLPAVGRILRFDKKDYSIKSAIDENGIYSIELEVNVS